MKAFLVLQSPISNLQSPISNLQSPISNLQSPISNLQSSIFNLQSPLPDPRSIRRHDNPAAMRVSGELPVADRIMKQTMFLGTSPGLTVEMIDYMVKVIRDFVASKTA